MLPECRTGEENLSMPQLSIDTGDINEFMEELRGFHQEFAGCFSRQEPRDNFFSYMVGQLSQLERKSIEPIALNLKNAKVRALQFFVSDVVWDDNKIIAKYRSMVNEDLGDENGVIIFDEFGYVKKGDDSAGVARQYCGSIGKVENSQVGVFSAYASKHGYCLVGNRLFVPDKWFSKDYAERRRKCKFPKDLEGFALRHFLPGSAVNRGGGGMRGQALIARHGGKI